MTKSMDSPADTGLTGKSDEANMDDDRPIYEDDYGPPPPKSFWRQFWDDLWDGWFKR